jgi:hypothetical protein
MVASFILASICALAIAFYLRFLVALSGECHFARICYLVRIQPEAIELAVVEARNDDELSVRAA